MSKLPNPGPGRPDVAIVQAPTGLEHFTLDDLPNPGPGGSASARPRRTGFEDIDLSELPSRRDKVRHELARQYGPNTEAAIDRMLNSGASFAVATDPANIEYVLEEMEKRTNAANH